MTTTVELHDPRTLGLEQRLEVARLQAACFSFAYPDDPPLIPEVDAEGMLQEWGDERSLLILARSAQGRLVGVGQLHYDLKQNTDQAHLNALVLPEVRQQGIGRLLATRLAEEALRLGRTTYTAATSSRVPAGEAFAATLAARAALPMRISELLIARLDAAQLQQWVTRRADDVYRLHRFDYVPPHELERVARVFEVMNTAPKGELEFDDWVVTPDFVESQQKAYAAIGGKTLLYVTEHVPSSQFVAFTQVGWIPQRAALVQQWGTGVHPDHRGQGLGKWLKAALLQDLPEHNPQAVRVRTGNADVNAAMLGINVALGFAPAFSRTEWQGQTQAILDAVSATA